MAKVQQETAKSCQHLKKIVSESKSLKLKVKSFIAKRADFVLTKINN